MQETTPATTATDPKRRYLCRHVFTEGHRCGSPALRGKHLCYNHSRSRREAPISGRSGTFPMPRIDDRAAIQLALFEVLSRLSGGDIDYKRGGILLYGLQIASSNLPRHAAQTNAEQQPQVDEVTHDIHLGDLAPIAEFHDPEQLEEASLVKLERTNPDRAKMKRWLASKRQPASPANGIFAPLAGLAERLPSADHLASDILDSTDMHAASNPGPEGRPQMSAQPSRAGSPAGPDLPSVGGAPLQPLTL